MPILKFWEKDDNIILDNFIIEDISNDKRTSLIDKNSFLRKEFKIKDNIYIAINDSFFKLARIFKTKKYDINAILIRNEKDKIIIIPSKNYIFFNGKSIEPEEYILSYTDIDIQKIFKL